MNISAPSIRRPIATCLLALGMILLGAVTYLSLPVASLPSVDLPIVSVSASLPGANPETVAATVAAPLERHLGEIPGVTAMTSTSTLGSTRIRVQFAFKRNIDSAAQDVQAAINAAQADLPGNLPRAPRVHKANPSGFPILILALTSENLSAGALYDAADTVIAQRIAQVRGVSGVSVIGAEQPAIRVNAKPRQLAHMGLGWEAVRRAIRRANVTSPLGAFAGPDHRLAVQINDGLENAAGYRAIPVGRHDGALVRLSDVAQVKEGTRDRLRKGWFDGRPAVILIVERSPGANVVATVGRIKALLPGLDQWIPSGVDVSIFSDRTRAIQAGVNDLQYTLLAAICLVMLVVLLFLRRGPPTLAAGVTVPLSLAGTVAVMWLAGYSLNTLSLMALTISVGFVVDDAIVMIENVYRNLESGMRPLRAAFAGAKQIGFTVVAISAALIAAFIPLLLMGGIVGELLRQFSVTLAVAIAISAVVSLTVTPMVCSRLIRRAPRPRNTRLDRVLEPVLGGLAGAYTAGLRRVIRHPWLTLAVIPLALLAMAALFVHLPKEFIPRGDTGLLFGHTQASPATSFSRMVTLQKRVQKIVLADPAVAHVGDSVGSAGPFSGGGNEGRMFISLKPRSQRAASASQVVARLRPKLARVQGVHTFLSSAHALPTGIHHSEKGAHQITLWSPDESLIRQWTPRIVERMRKLSGLRDVDANRNEGGPRVNVRIDRSAAARLHVSASRVDAALNDAFSQRQISTIYKPRNQYKVVLGVPPRLQSQPEDLHRIFVSAADGGQVPLSAVTTLGMGTAPLSVHHDGQYPSLTVSYNLGQDVAAGTARERIRAALTGLHMPPDMHVDTEAKAGAQAAGGEMLLLVAALLVVYLVLGILYESLIHPLTILSTLPSAGLGALLALALTSSALSLISVIGIILLIGLVMKNGIMLVDFALQGERRHGWAPDKAIFEAARERFRPITMTTIAAVLVAVPLIVAAGPGAALRRPLGITIVGGLIVAQLLTIFTTPVIYLLLDRFRRNAH